MRKSTLALLMFVLITPASGGIAADLAPLKPAVAKGDRASGALRRQLNLYLRFLKATPKELGELRAQDPTHGIWLMERNLPLRARLELVAILSRQERETLLNGTAYCSPPYAKLPKEAQAWMDAALGTDRLEAGQRDQYRYMLQVRESDGAEQLMINQVDPTGRPRSGGGVMPGVKRVPEA